MGDSGAKANGLPKAPVEVEDSVRGLLSHIVGATREKSSGRFWSYEQTTEIGW
jgi:norsolorinic acid ketoreductase